MTNSKRYESGSAPDRADLRLSRESRADRAARQRLHERLLDERMWREANSCAKKRRYVTYEQASAAILTSASSTSGSSLRQPSSTIRFVRSTMPSSVARPITASLASRSRA